MTHYAGRLSVLSDDVLAEIARLRGACAGYTRRERIARVGQRMPCSPLCGRCAKCACKTPVSWRNAHRTDVRSEERPLWVNALGPTMKVMGVKAKRSKRLLRFSLLQST